MSNDELDQIEDRLGVQLPPEYRRFAANYPADLDADNRSHEIYDRALAVISETETLRLRPNPEMTWTHSCVVIGDSGCGDFYFLDVGELPAPVKCWNHETGECDCVASTIDSWYAMIVRLD